MADGVNHAAKKPSVLDSKLIVTLNTGHDTTPIGGVPSNPRVALLSSAWEVLDDMHSPSSLDSSTPRTYHSEDSDGLSAMLCCNSLGTPNDPSTPVASPVKTPPTKMRTPTKKNSEHEPSATSF